MRRRYIGALALVAALTVSAMTAAAGSTSPDRQNATKIVIWLQNDAESSWPSVVAATNQAFKARHSDVDVDVQYQTWGDHLTKFDAALAGGTAPDVIELGNTETTRYMAARLLQDITTSKGSFPNSRTWLRRAHGLLHVQGPALLRAVLRRRPCRHLPQGPVQGGGNQGRRRRASPSSRLPAAS